MSATRQTDVARGTSGIGELASPIEIISLAQADLVTVPNVNTGTLMTDTESNHQPLRSSHAVDLSTCAHPRRVEYSVCWWVAAERACTTNATLGDLPGPNLVVDVTDDLNTDADDIRRASTVYVQLEYDVAGFRAAHAGKCAVVDGTSVAGV